MYRALGFTSAEDMIRRGYALEPEEINIAVEWLKLNPPDEPLPLDKAVKLGGRGRPKKGEEKPSNRRIKYGTTREYIAAKLDKEGHADLAAKVRNNEISARSARYSNRNHHAADASADRVEAAAAADRFRLEASAASTQEGRMTRRILPQRRYSETFMLPFGGFEEVITSWLPSAYYVEGNVSEIFINGGKSGEAVAEAIASCELARCCHVAGTQLRYGCELDTARHAITRDSQGAPSSIIGAVIDRLSEEKP